MILDVILVILFLLMLLYGYKKGCIGIVANLVSLIVAFVLAYLLAGAMGEYIANTGWGKNIQNGISSKFLEQEQIEDKETKNEMDLVETNQDENTSINDNKITVIQNDVIEDVKNSAVNKITGYVFTGLGFVIVFVAARIVLWLAQKILEGIFELPVLKAFNKFGGIITAALIFIIEVSVILAVIKSISAMTFMTGTINVIQSSIITKVLYEHNIVANIILSKII